MEGTTAHARKWILTALAHCCSKKPRTLQVYDPSPWCWRATDNIARLANRALHRIPGFRLLVAKAIIQPFHISMDLPSFGPVHIIEPRLEHTHTVLLLHGRGSSGDEFAQELLESELSGPSSLFERFPGCKWVFPSSPDIWSPVFEEDIPAWFDTPSLSDINARQDLQMPGIEASVKYISGLLAQEIAILHGRADRVVLGGISLGGATAMWTLLCSHDIAKPLGGFIAASTWLPFNENIQYFVAESGPSLDHLPPRAEFSDGDAFVKRMMPSLLGTVRGAQDTASLSSTPVFIGHGLDDAYVDIELGNQARQVLRQIGFQVEGKDYTGADQEGHWLKCPEEMDDMACFLSKSLIQDN